MTDRYRVRRNNTWVIWRFLFPLDPPPKYCQRRRSPHEATATKHVNEEFQRETGRWMDLTWKVAAVVPSMSLSGSIRNTPFSFDIVQAPNPTITPPKSHSPPAQSLFSLIHLFIEPHTPIPLTWTFETLPVCNLSGQNNTPRIPSKVEIRASMYCKTLSLHPGKLGLLKGHQT